MVRSSQREGQRQAAANHHGARRKSKYTLSPASPPTHLFSEMPGECSIPETKEQMTEEKDGGLPGVCEPKGVPEESCVAGTEGMSPGRDRKLVDRGGSNTEREAGARGGLAGVPARRMDREASLSWDNYVSVPPVGGTLLSAPGARRRGRQINTPWRICCLVWEIGSLRKSLTSGLSGADGVPLQPEEPGKAQRRGARRGEGGGLWVSGEAEAESMSRCPSTGGPAASP